MAILDNDNNNNDSGSKPTVASIGCGSFSLEALEFYGHTQAKSKAKLALWVDNKPAGPPRVVIVHEMGAKEAPDQTEAPKLLQSQAGPGVK